MANNIDYSTITLKNLAIRICEVLHRNGIQVILVGGACVSIYSQNHYQSYDLDFVSYQEMKKIGPVLAALGFKKKGRYFIHEACPFFIEFVNPPVAVGNEPVNHFSIIETLDGSLRLLTPTDCVKDRLAAFFHWKDLQGLEQAVLVASSHPIDLANVELWAKNEGHLDKFHEFLNKLKEHDFRAKESR